MSHLIQFELRCGNFLDIGLDAESTFDRDRNPAGLVVGEITMPHSQEHGLFHGLVEDMFCQMREEHVLDSFIQVVEEIIPRSTDIAKPAQVTHVCGETKLVLPCPSRTEAYESGEPVHCVSHSTVTGA